MPLILTSMSKVRVLLRLLSKMPSPETLANSVCGILVREDVDQRINIKTVQCTVGRQRSGIVTDQQVAVDEVHICFHAGAAGNQGVIEGYFPSVVVVGVDGNRGDVAAEVCGSDGESLCG